MQWLTGVRMGIELSGHLVGATGGRGDQGCPLPLAKVQPEVIERQLGQIFEGGGQLSGDRVGLDPARGLDHDPELGVLGDHVDSEQVAERVVPLLGDVEGAEDRRLDQGALDFHRPHLGVLGAAGGGGGVDRLRLVLRQRAGPQARRGGGIGGDALGEGHHRFFHVRIGPARHRAEPFVIDVEGEVQPAGGVGAVAGGLGTDLRPEAQPGAVFEAGSLGFAFDPAQRVLPGGGFVGGRERTIADAGQGHEGLFGGIARTASARRCDSFDFFQPHGVDAGPANRIMRRMRGVAPDRQFGSQDRHGLGEVVELGLDVVGRLGADRELDRHRDAEWSETELLHNPIRGNQVVDRSAGICAWFVFAVIDLGDDGPHHTLIGTGGDL